LKIHFDGWSSDFDFWTDDDWPDLHPVAWSHKSGHPLQPPLVTPTTEKELSENECPTTGCEGVGHIEGARYASHRSVEHCPYYILNLQRDSPVFPDRLALHDGPVDSMKLVDSMKMKPIVAFKCHLVDDCAQPRSPPLQIAVAESLPPSPESSSQLGAAPLPPPPPGPPPSKEENCSIGGSKVAEEMSSISSDSAEDSRSKVKVEDVDEFDVKDADGEEEEEEPSPVVSDAHEDSHQDPSPPKKKARLSYFTGKSAANVSVKDNPEQDKDKDNAKTEGEQLITKKDDPSPSEKPSIPPPAQPLPATNLNAFRSILEDYSLANTNLTTPLCWSKHSTLLKDLVADETCVAVAQWSPEQVNAFVAKFGTASAQLEQFKEQEIDGEALLYLSQNDLVDILGVKLGPAIKIRNALLLIKEKECPLAGAMQ